MQKGRKKQKSLKRRMNNPAILSFYSRRSMLGDGQRISDMTGYSESHISNVKAGRRRINSEIANAMYYLSRRRQRQEKPANWYPYA
jgi:hypothetical protein